MWKYLGDIGSVASLISLAVSIYVALNLRKIKNTYIFRARAPGYIRSMQNYASALIRYAEDFDNSKIDIGVELTKIDVRARAMQRRVRGESRRAAKRLRTVIKDYENDPNSVKLYAIYNAALRVVEEVKELQEDLGKE